MTPETLANSIADLKAPSYEHDILVWLLVGERLGVPIADEEGYLRNRRDFHFKPSEQWNGRTLEESLEWCRTHNKDEIQRCAYDWGVPHFTGNLQDATMLIPKGWKMTFLGEWDKRPGKKAGPWVARLSGPKIKAAKGTDSRASAMGRYLAAAALSSACVRAGIHNGDFE